MLLQILGLEIFVTLGNLGLELLLGRLEVVDLLFESAHVLRESVVFGLQILVGPLQMGLVVGEQVHLFLRLPVFVHTVCLLLLRRLARRLSHFLLRHSLLQLYLSLC